MPILLHMPERNSLLEKLNMDKDSFRQSFLQLVTILKYLGMWPTNTINPIIYWAYTLFLFIFFEIPIATLPFVNLFVKEDVGVLEIASGIFYNLQVQIVPFKMVFLLIQHKKLRKAVEIISSKAFSSHVQREHADIFQEGAITTKNTFNYIRLCLFTVALITSTPLINLREKPWLVEMWIPIDIKANWFNYFVVYLYTIIALVYCTLTNATVVVLICGLLIYPTTQIKVLKYTLTNITKCNTPEPQETYKNIIKSVKYYVDIVSFVKLVESTLSLMLGIQFLICTVVLCMSTFLLTVTPIDGVLFFAIFLYLFCILLETFLLCHFGEHLDFESTTICEAIYFGDWYNCDVKSKKAMLIFMERAKVPLTMSVAGLFKLSNKTFAKLVQKAYSLFTVLQRMDV